MDLKAMRRKELDEQKEKRKQEVVIAAIEVFKDKGIDNAKMTDIADRATVGIASVYRYFKTKTDIVIEAGTMIWKNEIIDLYEDYIGVSSEKLNGITQVKGILESFIKLYENHSDFIKFIYEFDNYVVREQITKDRLIEYEKNIIGLKSIMFNAIEMGQMDGSVSKSIDINVFYYTITHTLMSLCQKLVLRGNLLESDKEVEGKEQIRLVVDMAIRYLRNEG